MCRVDVRQVEQKLGTFIKLDRYTENGVCELLPAIQEKFQRPDAEDLLARTLEVLIGFIGEHKKDKIGCHFVEAAITLSRKCKEYRPSAVCGLFNAVDSILKRMGDKNKVFEAANLSIEASRHPHRSEGDVEVEAKALICGRSWVLQRVGHLDEALADAEKSLLLGEKIGWDRNTAFCKKCHRAHLSVAGAEGDGRSEKAVLP